ncbi:MAG: hypothetical protein ACKO84_01315 [Actinomycetota bacterium]
MSSAVSERTPSTTPVVSPAPTTEEAVAIVAAMEALWPRAVVSQDSVSTRTTSWRFSGRWWARPHIQRRVRP